MEKALFTISCTTCQARLTVRNESAIGAILECPKCGSMVLVAPPKGWVSKAATAAAVLEPEGRATAAAASAAAKSSPVKPLPEGVEWTDAVSPILIEPPRVAVPPAVPPPAPVAPPPAMPVGATVGVVWNKWVLLGGVSLFALIVGIGVWAVFGPSNGTELPDEPVAEKTDEPPAPDEPSPQGPGPARIDRRWLPDQTALLLSLRPSLLSAEPKLNRLFEEGDDLWRQTCGPAVEALGLKRGDIRRLTWIAADGPDWRTRSLVVIQTEPRADVSALNTKGEAAGFSLFGVECRRLSGAAWPHPLAALDQWTVITGSEDLLRHLATRHDADLKSVPLKKLLAVMPADADATLMVDLAAARAAKWKLPAAVFDVWPAGKPSWHVLWEMPAGLGCTLHFAERLHGEMALVCGNESNAQRTLAALTALLPAAKEGVATQIKQLGEKLKEGQLTAAAAEHYETLLHHAAAALKAARCELAPDRVVWLRIDWSEGPGAVAAAALDSRAAIHGQWLAAGQEANALASQRILSGVTGYRKAEGKYPIGAAGGVLLEPGNAAELDRHVVALFGSCRLAPQAGVRLFVEQSAEFAHHAADAARGGQSAGRAGVERNGLPGHTLRRRSRRGRRRGQAQGRRSARRHVRLQPPHAARRTRTRRGQHHRHARRDEASRPLGVRRKRHGPPADQAALCQRPRWFWQRPAERDAGRHGRRLGAVRRQGRGPRGYRATGHDPRQRRADGRRARSDRPAAKPKPKPEEPKVSPKDPPEGEPAKPVAPAVDIAPLLARPVSAMELKKVPLGRAIDLLAGMSTVPVSFDPDALADLEVTPSDPVNIEIGKTTLGKALGTIVASRGLVCVAANGQVLVTSPAAHRETLVKRDYAVDDLCGAEIGTSEELAAAIQKLVAPSRGVPTAAAARSTPSPTC